MYEETTTGWEILQTSFSSLWSDVIGFLPRFVGAILIFFIGWLVAVAAGKLAWHIVKFLQLDRGLESAGFKRIWEQSGYKLDTGKFFYELVKWFVIVLSLMFATEILQLPRITEFLSQVVEYIPNVFIAAIILIIGVLVARFAEHAVRSSVKIAGLYSANFLAMVAKWAVLIFSFLIALDQLQIDTQVLKIAEIGIVVAVALAVGLAFGLGGRDHADELLGKWRKHTQE
ncbi:MAG: hypothetical protein AAB483_00735 [Patescibacteria group bacterium]